MDEEIEYVISNHAKSMIQERNLDEDWLWRALRSPDEISRGKDGNLHVFKEIPEKNNKYIHLIINDENTPHRIVTIFFDRRASVKRKSNQ